MLILCWRWCLFWEQFTFPPLENRILFLLVGTLVLEREEILEAYILPRFCSVLCFTCWFNLIFHCFKHGFQLLASSNPMFPMSLFSWLNLGCKIFIVKALRFDSTKVLHFLQESIECHFGGTQCHNSRILSRWQQSEFLHSFPWMKKSHKT